MKVTMVVLGQGKPRSVSLETKASKLDMDTCLGVIAEDMGVDVEELDPGQFTFDLAGATTAVLTMEDEAYIILQ